MAFVLYNPNPNGNYVGDCTVRAISKLTGQTWNETYWGLAIMGAILTDMPSSNNVWGAYLRKNGYTRHVLPDSCPDCYSIREFCHDFPRGEYMLATGSHVVAVVDGDYYDSWDSGDEVPVYYWEKGV